MKMRKAFSYTLAALAAISLLTLSGCGGDEKKPEPKKTTNPPTTTTKQPTSPTPSKSPAIPKDTKGKLPDIKYTLTKLSGYSQKTASSFGTSGTATYLYNGNIIIGDPESKGLQAIKVSGNTAAVDTAMFDGGILKAPMGDLNHPVVAGSTLYACTSFSVFRYDGTTLVNMLPKGVNVPSPKPTYIIPAPAGNYAAIFNQGNNCKLNKAVLENGFIKEVTPWFMTLAKNASDTEATAPFYQLGNVVFDGDSVYIMGSLTKKAAEDLKGRQGARVVISYSLDGKQKNIYGNPDWMAGDGIKTGTENFFITRDYVVVIDTQAGRGLSLYNKADGKYLGTYYSETLLQDKTSKIVGVTKISDKEWYIVYNLHDSPKEKLTDTRYIAKLTLH